MHDPLSKWIHDWRPDRRTRGRLFCFPHAGGGANSYRPWQATLSAAGLELCALEFPGRLARLRELPFTTLEPLVEELAQVLAPHLSRPFAFFGHSMGALVAFELTRRLRRAGEPQPLGLFVSGRPAPQLASSLPPLHTLPDERLLSHIESYYGPLPSPVMADAPFRSLVLDIMRADLGLLARYSYQPEQPLSCPIVAFGGRADPTVSAADLARWADQTSRFQLEMFEGGHFFLQGCREALLERIVRPFGPPLRTAAPL